MQPTVYLHDAFAKMLHGVRFHLSDNITQDDGAPYRADIVYNISLGAAIKYADGDIQPMLCATTIPSRYARDALVTIIIKACRSAPLYYDCLMEGVACTP